MSFFYFLFKIRFKIYSRAAFTTFSVVFMEKVVVKEVNGFTLISKYMANYCSGWKGNVC